MSADDSVCSVSENQKSLSNTPRENNVNVNVNHQTTPKLPEKVIHNALNGSSQKSVPGMFNENIIKSMGKIFSYNISFCFIQYIYIFFF